jgi:hypothetical protein
MTQPSRLLDAHHTYQSDPGTTPDLTVLYSDMASFTLDYNNSSESTLALHTPSFHDPSSEDGPSSYVHILFLLL